MTKTSGIILFIKSFGVSSLKMITKSTLLFSKSFFDLVISFSMGLPCPFNVFTELSEFNPTISDNIDHQVIVSLPNSFYCLDHEDQTQKNVQVRNVSVRIKFEKANGSYHMPFILSPYGFSSWVSR